MGPSVLSLLMRRMAPAVHVFLNPTLNYFCTVMRGVVGGWGGGGQKIANHDKAQIKTQQTEYI